MNRVAKPQTTVQEQGREAADHSADDTVTRHHITHSHITSQRKENTKKNDRQHHTVTSHHIRHPKSRTSDIMCQDSMCKPKEDVEEPNITHHTSAKLKKKFLGRGLQPDVEEPNIRHHTSHLTTSNILHISPRHTYHCCF